MNSFQLRIKIHIDCTPVWYKLPVNHILKISPDTQHYFGVEPNFLTMILADWLFRGVRVTVIDPFFITCNNSPDKYIIHRITDKLTTDIHSMWNLLRCQFMRYRSTAFVWFSKSLYLAMYGIFWFTKFFWQPTSTFCGFSSKTVRIFSIFHNLGLPECGKSLVFSSTVLKRCNYRCATRSLTTPPSISHILRVAARVLYSYFL